MDILAFINLKGGSGKTTSTVFTAHALRELGRSVLLVDADPQGSTLRWSETADWSIPTVALPVKSLHKRLPGITPEGIDTICIDTPPLENQAGIVYSALRSANTVIIPMAPTPAEIDVLPDVWGVIEEVSPLVAQPQHQAVLLNRTVANAVSTRTTRQVLEEAGHQVFRTEIRRLEHYAQALGSPITELGGYLDLAQEVEQLGAKA